MNKHILIITNSGDLHADLVVERLLARDARPFRLNLDEFPAQHQLDIAYTDGAPGGMLRHLPSGAEMAMADIGAVWTRKSADFRFLSDDELGPQERAYATAETEHMLTSLLLTTDGYWMNHPLASRSAMWKGEQLQRAAVVQRHRLERGGRRLGQEHHRDVAALRVVQAEQEGGEALVEQARLALLAGVVELAHRPGRDLAALHWRFSG